MFAGTISIPSVNAAVKVSASQNTRFSNKDSTPLGSVYFCHPNHQRPKVKKKNVMTIQNKPQ